MRMNFFFCNFKYFFFNISKCVAIVIIYFEFERQIGELCVFVVVREVVKFEGWSVSAL